MNKETGAPSAAEMGLQSEPLGLDGKPARETLRNRHSDLLRMSAEAEDKGDRETAGRLLQAAQAMQQEYRKFEKKSGPETPKPAN